MTVAQEPATGAERQRSVVLYITTEGLLQPIGYSQVFRFVLGLARRGHRYAIVSLERPENLVNPSARAGVAAELQASGIEWVFGRYRPLSNPLYVAGIVLRLVFLVRKILRRRDVRLVHARGVVAGLIALAARQGRSTPYLLDLRGYLVDERREEGRWFTNRVSLGAARAIERMVVTKCAGAVSLTRLGAEDILSGRFGPWAEAKPLVVVPTCADYGSFRLARHQGLIPPEFRGCLRGKLVIGLVGSLNRFYRLDEALRVFERVFQIRHDAHLLCLTLQVEAMQRTLERAGLEMERFTIASATPLEMPGWLSEIDWGLHLLTTDDSKRASMPTKLAEFLASGVRPLHHGCNSEVSEWVERCGSGYVLPSLDDVELSRAARFIAETTTPAGLLERARDISRPHFDLEAGLDRYHDLLKQWRVPS